MYASSVAYTKDAFVYASSSMAIIAGEIDGLKSQQFLLALGSFDGADLFGRDRPVPPPPRT